ncbi:OmpA family protein [Allorhizobium pseudoryzae]|uniref:OmpA family protein n=1 Tax=Allorhizobium pseudoryzae TaxID=379684 RepID=UPI003CFE6324
MPKRNGLLAGVALPLMSLSLLAEPALSQMRMPQLATPDLPLIRVQAQILPPADGQPQAQPEGEPEKQAPAEEPKPAPEAPPQEPPAAEQPQPPAAEAPAAPAPEPTAPEPPRDAAPPQPAAPEPAAPEPAAPEPAAPEPEPVKPPAPAEDPAPAAPSEPSAPQPEAAPAPDKAAPSAEQPKPEETSPPAAAPKAEEPVAPSPEPAAPAAPAAPDASAPTEQPSAEQPAASPTDAAPAPQDGTAPTGTAPTGSAPAEGAPAQSPAPATDGAAAPAQPPAPDAATAPPPAGAAPAAPQVASPTTPEEIERARRIAQDPASSNQTVVLPVENGAAVLDSAKEAPAVTAQPTAPGTPPAAGAGPRERRDGPRGAQQQAGTPPAAPPAPAPTSDAEAQAPLSGQAVQPLRIEPATAERGERLRDRPRYDRPRGFEERGEERDGRVIISIDNRTVIRHDDSRRFYEEGYRPEYERLRGGRTREVIERDSGVRIVTIRNRYGDIVQRSRIGRDGREYVLYYAPELMDDRRDPDYVWRDPGVDLPPMRLTVPVDQYIIDTSTEPDRDYYDFLEQPPVERVERVYSLDEVRYSARIRDKVRRIDLDTITFATGSAEIPMTQARSLRKVAEAMKAVLDKDPSETFLIEGHTDAVGSDDSNLVLSDRRAESVAVTLTDVFGIPPENLATQGYGERYLKVRTEGPSQDNRRVTIRRITPLVKPVAQNR